MAKNANLSSVQNGSIQATLRADKASSFYSPTGFNPTSFHQIQQQNGNLPSYNLSGGTNFDPNVPQHYKLSTLAHPSKVWKGFVYINLLSLA